MNCLSIGDGPKLLMKRRAFATYLILFGLAAWWSPNLARGDAESVLGELNRKPAAERLRLLTEGARKERVLSFTVPPQLVTHRTSSELSTRSTPL